MADRYHRMRLEQQLRQAERLSALGQMMSGIAHELNNPMAVIKGYLDVILTHHPLSARTRADLQTVAEESNRAVKLVQNLLAFAGEQPVQRDDVDLNEVIRQAADSVRFDPRTAHVEIVFDLAPELPRTLADPDQLAQVLLHLLRNSLQAVTGPARRGRIKLSSRCADQFLRVTVEDNGPGIPKELESKIFEPFFTTKDGVSGAGLGLAIAHSLVAGHQGRITCQTSSLGGAAFVIELPWVSEEHPVGATIIPLTNENLAPNSPAASILVLDDEQPVLDMLGQMLDSLGHQPTLSCSPVQALEEVQRRDFDLVLSDFRMPVLDGEQFYKKVAALKPWLAARIVFLTGDVANQTMQGFIQSIGNPCLTKPFHLQALQATLTRLLQGSPTGSDPCPAGA
jgi:two-component system, NtrC family, sensor kinase